MNEMLRKRMSATQQASEQQTGDAAYERIEVWQAWYRGKVPAFHTYRQYNGKRKLTRQRRSLGMAKAVAEDWANLALNEKVEICIKGKQLEKRVREVLENNNFRVRGNQLLEETFALGTGAFVERMDGDDVRIDYVRAGMIYPLAWHNGAITECAFASERQVQKEKQVYLNIHRMEHGKYVVENHLFRRTGDQLTEIPLPEGVEEVVRTGRDEPQFQIIRPNIANNLEPDCPMGISVYANAIDQLEGLDLVYDSYCNEFRLGKKRITIPMTMARMAMEEDGSIGAVFDDNDTEFYAVPSDEGNPQKIEEHNMTLRYEAHEAGVQTALNLLSFKCGMGRNRYNFKDGQVKTATEVVSEKSDLYQSLRKHELLLSAALVALAKAIAGMLGASAQDVTVNFDDSIIEDTGAEKDRFLQEIRDGVRQKWEYRVKFFGEDEQMAKAMTASDSRDEEQLFPEV